MSCDYCDWIERVLTAYKDKLPRKKPNLRKKFQRKRRLEPIIIIHGLPGTEKIDPNGNFEFVRKIAIEKYRSLREGKSSVEITESTMIELENFCDSKKNVWKDTVLVDDNSRFGCVSGMIQRYPISIAKKIIKRKKDICQIIDDFDYGNGIVTRESDDEVREKNSNDEFGCWSVIVRDLEENLSVGRTNWTAEKVSKISINASTIIYGCGIYVEDESCCSVCGDDELIYINALAKKISRLLEEKHNHKISKSEIDEWTSKFEKIGVIFLGPCERPVISCQSDTFPWIYCCKEKAYFGEERGEVQMRVIESDDSGCQCFEK